MPLARGELRKGPVGGREAGAGFEGVAIAVECEAAEGDAGATYHDEGASAEGGGGAQSGAGDGAAELGSAGDDEFVIQLDDAGGEVNDARAGLREQQGEGGRQNCRGEETLHEGWGGGGNGAGWRWRVEEGG